MTMNNLEPTSEPTHSTDFAHEGGQMLVNIPVNDTALVKDQKKGSTERQNNENFIPL